MKWRGIRKWIRNIRDNARVVRAMLLLNFGQQLLDDAVDRELKSGMNLMAPS
jgi:hypothetical protein